MGFSLCCSAPPPFLNIRFVPEYRRWLRKPSSHKDVMPLRLQCEPPDSMNINTFSDWRRTGQVTWIKHNNRSYSLEQRQICEQAGVKQTTSSQFFSSFELGGITLTLNDWSRGKRWVFSPRPQHLGSRGNKTHCSGNEPAPEGSRGKSIAQTRHLWGKAPIKW